MPDANGWASRGSRKWLQLAVNRRPELLRHQAIGDVEWTSPRAEAGFAEYHDAAFLRNLGLDGLADALAAFWPAGGPRWDALGRAGDRIVLVEAKAHLDEFFSDPCGASPGSRERIEAAFARVRAALGVTTGASWSECFYQYANRLAHLHFLRSHDVDAVLLLVGFVNDRDMNGPSAGPEWMAALRTADHALGLPRRHALSPYVLHVHPDVRALADL